MADSTIMLDPRVLKPHPRNAEFFDDVDGADFDRLVESIREHGVLTPLRVTKDMTIISGHQRVRAAIEAECFTVPAIIDESDDNDDILMKLIETNFGRMKNDPIKQAKWIEEYKQLMGVKQGKAGQRSLKGHNVLLRDIADQLGVNERTVKRLTSLLKLDPVLQQYISDGKITPTTGFTLLSSLSAEEQLKLIERLPDDIKLSAPTVKAHIDQIRAEVVANAAEVQKENDQLRGKNEQLIREKNELLAGNIPENTSALDKIDKLEQEQRASYEKLESKKKEIERLRKELDKALMAKADAETKVRGGNEVTAAMQEQIDALEGRLRETETALAEKEAELSTLEREKNSKLMRSAVTGGDTNEEYHQREIDNYVSRVQGIVTAFRNGVTDALLKKDILKSVNVDLVLALAEISNDAINYAQKLHAMLIGDAMQDAEINNEEYSDDDIAD